MHIINPQQQQQQQQQKFEAGDMSPLGQLEQNKMGTGQADGHDSVDYLDVRLPSSNPSEHCYQVSSDFKIDPWHLAFIRQRDLLLFACYY